MPSDTGAPFFLPYPEDTDLVRDGASDIEALADATATALAAAGTDDASDLTTGTLAAARLPAGSIIQVAQTVKTDVFSTTSTGFTAVTGLSVSITPAAASHKILVIVAVSGSSANGAANARNFGRIMRGGTVLAIGNSAGSRTRSAFDLNTRNISNEATLAATVVLLDSPGTTSSTAYSVQIVSPGGGLAHINRGGGDSDISQTARTISSITVIEVKA